MDILYLIVIGLVAGFLAGLITSGRGFGWLANIIIGVIGAFIGKWLFDFFNISIGSSFIKQLISATAGSLILVLIVNAITGKRERRRRRR